MRFDGNKWLDFFWDEWTTSSISINKEIDEKLFGPSGVFVPGLTVLDANLGSVYIYGGKTLDALEDVFRAEVSETIAINNDTVVSDNSPVLQPDVESKASGKETDSNNREIDANRNGDVHSESHITNQSILLKCGVVILLLTIVSMGIYFILYKKK